ncbi:MAG: RNA polymerase sigma factor (sigma-70 family) [Myxococcota bacterium]|jgi:RNA polymerase sigma factor (sigma-70 family)
MANAEPRSDEALFAAYVAGERAAFEVLFDRFGPLITRVVRRRVHDRALAQDLVQQTFLQMHRARHDFRPDGKVRPWLVTIAMNVVRQHWRKTKRVTEVELQTDGTWFPTQAPHDPVAFEHQRQIHAALAKLTDKTRRAIELHWIEGMPFPEVAEVLGASTTAVKVRAHRGYAQLRTLLEAMGVSGV